MVERNGSTTAECSSRPVWFPSNSSVYVRILKHGQLTHFECEYKMATRQLKESTNTNTRNVVGRANKKQTFILFSFSLNRKKGGKMYPSEIPCDSFETSNNGLQQPYSDVLFHAPKKNRSKRFRIIVNPICLNPNI